MTPIKTRDLWMVGLLSVVTLGIYNVYLMWAWSREVNGILREERYNPMLVLFAGIVSCGMSGCIFETLFARDLELQVKAKARNLLLANGATVILVLNILGLVLDLTAIGVVIGFPLGVAATVLLQRELNEWSRRFGTAASATAS